MSIISTPAVSHPEFCAMVLNVLLFKLGGQVVIPVKDLTQVCLEYPSFRLAMDLLVPGAEAVTLTLLSADYLRSREDLHGEER